MDTTTTRRRRARSPIVPAVVLALLVAWVGTSPALAQDPSVAPASAAPASPTLVGPAMCRSAADLRLYVGFVRSQSLDEEGLVPILVGVAAALAEAERLLGLVDAAYRPLVGELVASLRELGASVRTFRDQGTIGSGLTALGEAISRVGEALDALTVAIGDPCPADPGASADPGVSASPAPAAA